MPDRRTPMLGVRLRFWVEATLCMASAALFLVTQIWPDWIELVFGVDPDKGNGSLEWLLLVALILVAAATFSLARRERHRAEDLDAERTTS